MPEVKFKVYPRGFLGAVLAPRAIRQHGMTESARGFSNKDFTVMADQNKFDVGNPTVEELYHTYTLDREKAKDMEWREQVLKAAMSAFGAYDFLMWFEAQYQNPSAGDLHARFLADTIKFFMHGTRDVSLENWMAIITIDQGMDPVGKMPDIAKEFFGIGKKYRPYDTDWASIIQLWCSQPNGFEDLINSLQILFGAPQVQ